MKSRSLIISIPLQQAQMALTCLNGKSRGKNSDELSRRSDLALQAGSEREEDEAEMNFRLMLSMMEEMEKIM